MTTVKAQEKFVTVNGVQLRYLDWGTAGKTPLVCLHGHTGQAHIWDEFAEATAPTLPRAGRGPAGARRQPMGRHRIRPRPVRGRPGGLCGLFGPV